MPVEESLLWSVLHTKAPRHEEQVRVLVEHAAGLLLTVRDTFPTYTLHDERHAENLVRIMGDLLRPGIDDVSGLEAAMLILAAYFHDIGMVYTRAELARLNDEEEFTAYLRANPQEYVNVHGSGGKPPQTVLENYCRFRHADRVWEHLNRVDKALLRWGSIPFAPALAEVCRSHNRPVEALKDDDFKTRFLGECDLRMCAIMLRLADILDFDTSRTPASAYRHLGLADHSSEARAVSDREWRRHLFSDGFRFPDERPPGYLLGFAAGPDDPAVEHDIRSFLDVIDDELRRCRSLLDFCADRWRRLPLPSEVDRSDIHSDGYRYGAFTFELDRSAVLDLFVGENLYQNPYTFVRELLQNSIDAVRLRAALGLHEGDDPRVDLESWEDRNGFIWFRIEDSGIGMDDDLLHRYFLRVGRSYYESTELKAHLLMRGGPARFGAISRFGIGVLSCFLSGDHMELSTRRIRPDGDLGRPLRLSMNSAADFFVLREPPMDAPPLQGRYRPDEKSYRSRPGTTVLVRINPAKTDITPERIRKEVEQLALHPPVPVNFNGMRVGSHGAARSTVLPLPREVNLVCRPSHSSLTSGPTGTAPAIALKEFPYHGDLRIVQLPLDISEASRSPSLGGQLTAVSALPDQHDKDLLTGWPEEEVSLLPEELRDLLRRCVTQHHASTRFEDFPRPTLSINLSRQLDETILKHIQRWLDRNDEWTLPRRDSEHRRSLRQLLDLTLDLHHVTEYTTPLARDLNLNGKRTGVWIKSKVELRSVGEGEVSGIVPSHPLHWSHNGIATTTSLSASSEPGRVPLPISTSGRYVLTGVLLFTDDLRPDLDLARGKVLSVPFPLWSALHLALRRATETYVDGPYAETASAIREDSIDQDQKSGFHLLGEILSDPLVSEGQWDAEKIVDVNGRHMSVADMQKNANALVGAKIRFLGHGFYSSVARALLRRSVDVAWCPESYPFAHHVHSAASPELKDGLLRFRPFSFVRFPPGEVALGDPVGPNNFGHPLNQWIIENINTLNDKIPTLMRQIVHAVNNAGGDEEGTKRCRTEIRAILDRIRQSVDPAVWPPDEAYSLQFWPTRSCPYCHP